MWRKLLVSALGTGYLPAGGTWGSLWSVAIFLAIAAAASRGGAVPQNVAMIYLPIAMLALSLAASIACVALGDFAEKTYGRKDPGQCTIDEVAGQALALAWLPLGASMHSCLIAAAAGFVAFRIFDIVKVPPAWQLQSLPKGWGILMDDIAAGVYANGAAQLVLRLTPLATWKGLG